MVLVPAAVEHDLAYTGGLGALGNGLADDFGSCDVAAALQILLGFAIDGARGDKSLAREVVDDLRVNVSQGAVHAKARTLRRSLDARAHTLVHALAVQIPR